MKHFLSHANRRDLIVMLKMLSPMLCIVAIGIHFKEFVIHAVEVNVAINAGIMAAASYGVLLIVARLIAAMRDFRVIERFGHEARGGADMKVLLNEPWVQRRYVRHYLAHIAVTEGVLASQLDQNAIESELHALQTEYESKMELPQFLVGFMIAMGLLGTFIGLLETLTGISGMLDGMGGQTEDVQAQFMKLVTELKKPLAGMGIAFSASMFGLITSLMLAIMMTNLRRFVGRVMSLARNVMHDLITLVRINNNMIRQDANGEATMVSEVDNGGGRGASMSTVAGRFDLLSRKIDGLLQIIETNAIATQKTNDLLGFGPRMRELSERTVDELREVSSKATQQQALLQNMVEQNTTVVRVLSAVLEAQKMSNDSDTQLTDAIDKMSRCALEQLSATRQVVESNTLTSRTIGDLLEAQKSANDASALIADSVEKVSRGIAEQLGVARQTLDASAASGRAINDLIDVQRQSIDMHSGQLAETRAVVKAQQDQNSLQRQAIDAISTASRLLTDQLDVNSRTAGYVEGTLSEVRSLVKAQVEHRRVGQGLLELGDSTVRSIDNNSEALRQAIAGLVQVMQAVDNKIAKGEEVSIGSARHLFELKDMFARIVTQTSTFDALSVNIGGQTALLESMCDEIRLLQRIIKETANASKQQLPLIEGNVVGQGGVA